MNFDRLAPHYDWMEAVCGARRLQAARTTWLDELQGCRRILSVGEGHGRFAAACAARFPAAELTCVEASAAMLARAKARTPVAPIRWHCADVRDWQPEGNYDAIVTCFFLDCFPPETLRAVVGKLAACAAPGALWLQTDFAVPASGPARWRARLVHTLMYAFFRRVVQLPAERLTPPDDLLLTHGFSRVAHCEMSWGLLNTEIWRRIGEPTDQPIPPSDKP